MRKIFIVFVLVLVCSVKGNSQDIIIKNDKTELKAKVLELTEDVVKYKKFEMLDGPIYSINKADVFMIMYSNGTKEYVESKLPQKASSTSAATTVYSDSKDPNVMHKSGVYIYDPSDVNNPVKRIEAVRTRSQTSSGGYGGFSGSSKTAIISGNESRQKISEQNPVFYFYFPQETKSDDWFASSPNEFALVEVKVIPKKNMRIFKTGGSSSNGFSSSSSEGIPEKYKLQFEFVLISEGIYKITVKSPLKYGEYCFTYADNVSRVFDFGIK